MGEDKSLLPFKNFDTMIEYQYDKLKDIFENVYISSKNKTFPFTKNIIFDTIQDTSSPMVALASIFNSLHNDKIFIITVDTPFVSKQSIFTMLKSSHNYDITITKTKGDKTHNLCGVFSKSLYPNIQQYLANDIHRIGMLIKENKTNIVFCKNEDEFLNVNTKEDYQKALKSQ